MSTISAGTTTTTALVSTGDTTGNLVLATGSVPTTALTLNSTTQAATFAGAVTAPSVTTPAITVTGSTGSVNSINTFGFKNRIINGGMTIDQRNAGASVTPVNAQYLTDRFSALLTQASKFTAQQNAGSVTPPAGFINYLGMTSTSAYTVGSSDGFAVLQKIEGLNVADLDWGTANAKTVTLSFWVRSSLTGTFGGSLLNSAVTASYPFSYTISSANTWTQISVTVPGPTIGTWLTTNGLGIQVVFGMGIGSTYSGTANTWAAAYYLAPTGATSVVGTSGATFYITGVQLEVGSQATSFDFRDYGTEFARCQRYYEVGGGVVTQTNAYYNFYYKVTKRTSPTLTNVVAAGGSVSAGTADGVNQWYQNSNASALSTMSFTASAEL